MKIPNIHIVYFSSATGATKSFVEKLGIPATAIPINGEPPIVNEPYVLITPTYGGGAALMGRKARSVPIQVSKFLDTEDNSSFMKAVIASGNSNFGSDYGRAGELISKKYGVKYVWRFEIRGTQYDIDTVLEGLSGLFGVKEVAEGE